MTVVKVTNATLKGSVKGPTFTGDVDGATFTGDVTYTDTTPPIEPPSTTDGRITNFNPVNKSVFQIGGISTTVQNANGGSKSWCIQKPDDYTLRFEVRSGDRWIGESSGNTSERSEVGHNQNYPAGTQINASWGFVMEAGSNNTAGWFIIGQLHQNVAGGSPPWAMAMYGEKMHCLIRDNPSVERRVYADPNPIQRGHKYAMRAEVKFASNGFCRVWRDGAQIVNYNGAIGYGSNESYYWKQGVYRDPARETVACRYSNLLLTSGSAAADEA